MSPTYQKYLVQKAKNGDRHARHQLLRRGIDIEPEGESQPAEVSLYSYQGETEGRIIRDEPKPRYLCYPIF